MTYYGIRSDGAYLQFDGMQQDAIVQMLSTDGLTINFIDQAAYEAGRPQTTKDK